MVTQNGSCHCGKVTFEFSNSVSAAMECNCSICRRKGALWHAADNDHFRILSGQDELSVYQFGTKDRQALFLQELRHEHLQQPAAGSEDVGDQSSLCRRYRPRILAQATL